MKKKRSIKLSACTACGNLAPLGGRDWCHHCTEISTLGFCVICKQSWYFCPKKDYGQCNQEEYDAFRKDKRFICNGCLEYLRCSKCGCADNLLLLCDGEGCRAKDQGYSKAMCLSCSGEANEPEHYYCEECKMSDNDDALLGQKWREKARLKGRIAQIDIAYRKGEAAFSKDGFAQVEADIQKRRDALIPRLEDNAYLATTGFVEELQTFTNILKNAVSKKRERQEKTDELLMLKKQRQELEKQLSNVQTFLDQEKKREQQSQK